MKKILFKALSDDEYSERWVYGGYYQTVTGRSFIAQIEEYPPTRSDPGGDGATVHTPVRAETVCQYIQLNDIKNTPIFFNDRIKIYRQNTKNNQMALNMLMDKYDKEQMEINIICSDKFLGVILSCKTEQIDEYGMNVFDFGIHDTNWFLRQIIIPMRAEITGNIHDTVSVPSEYVREDRNI